MNRTYPLCRPPTREKGIVAIVLLVVAAIVGIVVWVASSGSVDAREGARLGARSTASALVQQAVALEQGFGDMVSRGIAPESVVLMQIYDVGLLKPIQLPAGVAEGVELKNAQPGMSAAGWSLLLVQTVDTRELAPVAYIAMASTPLKPSVCSETRRMAGTTTGTAASVFAQGSYAAGTVGGAPAVISYNLEFPVSGCVTDSVGATFYLHPIVKLN